jgi:hypothetical protein
MFGRGGGCGLPFIAHSTCLTIGVDHDVVNGAPVARLVSRLREEIESASVLANA